PNMIVQATDLAAVGPLLTSLQVPASGSTRVTMRFGVDAVAWATSLAGAPVWKFGDGTTGRGNRTSHAFSRPGRYTVSVTQLDVTGRSATESANVLIVPSRLRNVDPPTTIGTAHVGSTLTCTRGRWLATAPTRFSYRWLHDSRVIPNAVAPRYMLRAEDAGALITCSVTATNAAGTRTVAAKPRRIRR